MEIEGGNAWLSINIHKAPSNNESEKSDYTNNLIRNPSFLYSVETCSKLNDHPSNKDSYVSSTAEENSKNQSDEQNDNKLETQDQEIEDLINCTMLNAEIIQPRLFMFDDHLQPKIPDQIKTDPEEECLKVYESQNQQPMLQK